MPLQFVWAPEPVEQRTPRSESCAAPRDRPAPFCCSPAIPVAGFSESHLQLVLAYRSCPPLRRSSPHRSSPSSKEQRQHFGHSISYLVLVYVIKGHLPLTAFWLYGILSINLNIITNISFGNYKKCILTSNAPSRY